MNVNFKRSIHAVLLLLAGTPALWAQWSADEDTEYVARFTKHFQAVEPAATLEAYANPDEYDKRYMGERLDADLANPPEDGSGIAWGWSYRMMSLNAMYRATGERRYLEANFHCITAILGWRDDKRNIKLWNGTIAPVWSSGKYSERGQAVFAVHTGIIAYPMLDFVQLAKSHPIDFDNTGDQLEAVVASVQQSLAWHDRQWRDGPGDNEGYYIGMDQEKAIEGKPLPGNRLSSMGRALWLSWKVSKNETHRDRALAIGRYIKNRLTLTPDGAYYWPYWLPLEPVRESAPKQSVNGEDVSHGSLTMSLPILLAEEGTIFDKTDMERLGKTVSQGFARLGDGILFGGVTGNPASDPAFVQIPARWLRLTPFVEDVYPRIADFYLQYQPSPGPLDLALLIRYKDTPPIKTY